MGRQNTNFDYFRKNDQEKLQHSTSLKCHIKVHVVQTGQLAIPRNKYW